MSFNQKHSFPKSAGGHAVVPSNQTLLLEKVNARTSTPDSEALASSDDEAEQRHDSIYAPASQPKPVRRSSWLNEPSQPLARPRKESFASSTMSPTASHPSTPSAENANGPWGPHAGSSAIGRGAGSFSWGSGIWNNERKDASTRFSEVLPSPTSAAPPGGNGTSFFGANDSLLQTSPNRDLATNTQIPFAIPLHPTPKTYRSQSYSVGQLDQETNLLHGMSSSAMMGRRGHPALQHRPSRPSMLSEMSNDGSLLGKVKEVDDDDENASEMLSNSYHHSTESQKIEMLTRENAMLRQQQYNNRRPRASTGASYLGNGYGLQEPVPEESDFAVDELDGDHEPGESFMNRMGGRRMSEYAAGVGQLRSPFGVDNRKGDNSNLKRALWSSQLGFTGPDVSQSRRHSFANMPTRQGSISSLADSTATLEAPVPEGQVQQDYGSSYGDSMGYMQGFNAPNYGQSMPAMHSMVQPGMNTAYPAAYGMQNQYRAPSPHRNLYGGMGQPRHNQPLYIVTFKCARADVFYIQEGTGLTVKPGDLVIVEADRGTDLGTVAQDNVDWASAKDLKDQWSEEHYKWLMMYSQGAAAASDGSGPGLMASSGGVQPSAMGGMGPPNQHHGMQEPTSGELRPKLIKRLAQQHEILSLRDKEGQEAKAKRVCTQKVKEHGLNMEILDAEFQVDWKKLTFYYFADAYINFNSLVTDLFKIYKTRIWMSAINPASFASPTLGIQAPSGVGPGAVNANRGPGTNERRQVPQQPQAQPQPTQEAQQQAYAQAQGNNRNIRPSYPPSFSSERNMATGTVHAQQNYGYGQATGLGMGRPSSGYSHQGASPSVDAFGAMGFQQSDLHSMRQQRFPTPGSVPSPGPHHSQGLSPMASSHEWTGGFQGLSLSNH